MKDSLVIAATSPQSQNSNSIWDVMTNTMQAFIAKNDWWAIILLAIIVITPFVLYFLLKYKMLTPTSMFAFFKFKDTKKTEEMLKASELKNVELSQEVANLSLIQTAHAVEMSELKEKIKKASYMRYQSDTAISDIKTIYYAEIDQQTETLITKSLTNLEYLFNISAALRDQTDASGKCKSCRKKSFRSASDNISKLLKDEVELSLEKNGFLKLEGKEFDSYAEDKWYVFLKIIRDSLVNYYIFNDELEENHVEMEKAYKNIENIVYDMLRYLKEKETKMIAKMEEVKKDFNSDFEKLINNK